MSVKNYIKEIEDMNERQALNYLNQLADEMKRRVMYSESEFYARARVIYVAQDGSDENDGLTEDTPIRTLAKVKEMMQDGDTFLFKRGDHILCMTGSCLFVLYAAECGAGKSHAAFPVTGEVAECQIILGNGVVFRK